MRTPVYDMPVALGAIALLRHIADHIERNGPSVMLSGGVSVDVEQEIVNRESCSSESRRTPRAVYGVRSIALQSNLVTGTELPYAPSCGIRQVECNGEFYRWDGEPPRPPKKGEFYLQSDAPTWVALATRNLKRPKHIVTLCT